MFRSSAPNRKLRFLFTLIALALVASACAQASSPQEDVSAPLPDTTPGSVDTGATPEPPPGGSDNEDTALPDVSPSAFLDLPANPLPVTFSTDDAASVSAEIGTGGGSLVTTDANGVVFTLTIPEGGLLSPATITMTPVVLTDSPFEGAAVAAVSLEPDGLVLMEAATLTISNADLDEASSVSFSSNSDGGEFGLVSASYGETLSMAVPHFTVSGTFYGSMMGRELEAIGSEYRPTSREGRYRQEVRILESRIDDPAQRYDALTNVLFEWYETIAADARSADDEATVKTLLGELAAAVDAFPRQLARDLAQASGEEYRVFEPESRAAQAIQGAVSRLFDRENLRCIQDRNPDAMFSMFRWQLVHRALAHVALYSIPESNARQTAMIAAVGRCAQFRVEFRSTVVLDTLTSTVSAEVALKASPDSGVIRGSGFVDLPVATGSMTGTTSGEPLICGAEQPIDVGVVLVFDANVNTIADATLFDPLLSIWLPLHLEWTCENMPVGVEMTPEVGDSLWKSWFVFGFSDLRADTDQDIYRFSLERDPSGSPFAVFGRKETIQGIEVTVEAILIHDPQLP